MKKSALGFIALAMMFMGNMAMAATQDSKGAIRSIDRCDQYGVVQPAGTIETSLTVGDKAYFRIRLENHNSYELYQAWAAGSELRNAWYFFDTTSGQPINPVQAGIKVGVFVTGRFALADVMLVTDEPFDPSDGGGPWFTDLICCYTVKPGDLALPMTLASSNKKEAESSDTTAYFLGQDLTLLTAYTPVQLRSMTHAEGDWSTIDSTNVCSFKFGDYWSDDGTHYMNVNGQNFVTTSGTRSRDYTLFDAGIFIQSIDFDKNHEKDDAGNEVWRAVHERSTSTKEYVPSLMIPGTVADDYTGYVYLWSADTNCVALPDATIPMNGTMVQKLNFDGSSASLQFRLRGVTQGTTEIFLSSTLTNLVSGSGRTVTNFVSRTVACVAPLEPMATVLANNSPTLTLNATADYMSTVPFKVELTQVWPNDEPVTVKFRYYLTNSTTAVSAANLSQMALIAISADQQFGYDSILPDSVTIPAGGTDSIELSTNVRALYALGALTDSNKGDTIVIEPYFENLAMASFFTAKPLTLTIFGMKPNILSVNGFAPDAESITSSITNSSLSVRGGVTSEFEVRVSDTYRNMKTLDGTNGYFTVTWQYEGGKKTTITNDMNGAVLLPDGGGILHVPMMYPVPVSDQNMLTTVKVRNADGRESEKSFYVYVKQPKNVTATLESAVVGEGGSPKPVTFTLSETAASSALYAFLEPASPAASNLSYAAFFTTNTVEAETRGVGGVGVPFAPGNLVAVSDALLSGNGLTFFDNSSDLFVYNIRLSSSPTWDPAARVTEFIENQLVVTVTNNFPVITQVMARNNANGKDKPLTSNPDSPLTMSLSDPMRTFRVNLLNDVDLDKNGVESNQVVYAWEAYKYDDSINGYPSTPNLVSYTVGLNSTNNMEAIFGSTLTEDYCGRYKFCVYAQDKDMRGNKPQYLFDEGGKWTYDPWRGLDTGGAVAPVCPEGDALNPGNDWSGAYTFYLRIDKNPYVDTNPFGASATDTDGTPIFRESDLLNSVPMGFTVGFNDKPNVSGFLGVSVAVTITPVDAAGNEVDFATYSDGVPPYIAPKVSTTTFSFTASVWSNKFTFTDFDGSWWGRGLNKKGMRYRVVAAVTSTSESPSGTRWNELYTPSTNYFRLENSAPVVTVDPDYEGQDSETNAVLGITYAPNEHFNFRWSVGDILNSDLERPYTEDKIAEMGSTNLIVTCSVVGGYEVGSITNQSSGTFSVWFEKPGINKLRISATDKDGDTGYSKVVWFFVETSKNVFLYPYGPSRSSIDSDEVAKYRDQPGLGVGRVWSDGGFGSIKAYMHTWTYGTSARTAWVYGEGYSARQMDTSTAVGKSTAPKQDGSSVGEGDERYENKSDYDSFFYRWFKMEPGKSGSSGGSASSSGGSSDAEWVGGAPSPGKTGNTSLTLPMQETNYTYPDSSALAVFSREKYVADNMGDVNGDGIPDAFAATYWTSDAGESKRLYEIVNGGESGGEDGSVNDLADISDYNDDGDFLPVVFNLGGNPLKPTVFDWGPGVKFDALKEIRGLHQGLNEPGISDYDLSLAERYALFADYATAGNVLTGVLDDDYIAATNWATATLWTPEAWTNGAVGSIGTRLNSAKADTDGDGMDDGWEYFFWYYAKVGAVTNGVWGRLEGRRYDLATPATGTRIPPAEIVAHFNPLERLERDELVASDFTYDFDNDGLTDLEEYALGTNPIDWDSDGDGMNDLWEVMNGLDPLSLDDDPEVLEYDSKADIHNMDRDFMARCTYEGDTFTVYTFQVTNTNEKVMFGLPTKTASSFEAIPFEPVTTNVYELVVENPAGVTNIYYTVAPAEYDDSVDPPALTADAVAFETVKSGDTVYLASMEPVTLPTGTASVLSAADADGAVEVSLASLYYAADMIINSDLKTVKIWFAEKPAVIHQVGTGLLQLAADTSGFATYDHVTNTSANAKSVPFLGEEKVFPAGTLLKAVANTPENMTRARVPSFIDLAMFGKYGGFKWVNPETLEDDRTPNALPLFNYGGDGKTYVPCSKSAGHYALAPVDNLNYAVTNALPVVNVERKHAITLIHNQVFNQYGFDPRTAWNIDEDGYVDRRWHNEDSEGAGAKGEAGLATRTVAYNSRDEYLVMQYRQEMRAINGNGTRSYTASLLNGGNQYLIDKGVRNIAGSVARFRNDTTYPNFPVTFVRELYQSRSEVNPFDNSTNRTVVTYWTWLEQGHQIHGADTDYDGIPDGWELYVNADPNNNDDAKEMDGWANDSDKLNILKEYAGVDSCNAYTNRFLGGKMVYPEAETITANHPGRDSGWWNKFFPTNPYDNDTDGDGVLDDAEGSGWQGVFYVGQNKYSPQSFTFIYGCKSGEANFEKYMADGKAICFRGGGLNPCTVDTDGDLLPDAWEFQFAGVVFKDGAPVDWSSYQNNPLIDDLQVLTKADGGHLFGKQDVCLKEGYEIRGGMDGTFGCYSDSPHDGDASMDFDHDGLANCQEYLVQSLRHLRYDDPYTPLMGIHPGTKEFLKFIPFSAWDGEAFHKRCLAAGFTGLGSWKFSELGYFTLPPHKWDSLYLNTTGQNACDNYAGSEGAGYRIMLPPVGFTATGAHRTWYNGARRYATTDPRRWDSDEDGMDDYYELFHGLNPLLGSAGCPDGRDEYDVPNTRFDVIADIHSGYVTSWRNHWTGWPIDRVQPAFDAIRFPWMMGTMECDADGDGLRNDEESIKVNLAKPSTTHTDPTPLWMTDSTSTKFASYTAQYYNPDPYITETPDYDPLISYPDIFGFPWKELTWYIATQGLGMSGATRNWMFAFEENEGYDTDHDFKRDAVELSGLPTNGVFKVEVPSDPKAFCDPDRRQAIYFPGVNSALATRDGKFTRAVSDEPDLLKQFTVELWVKPDGAAANAVLLERVCNYGPSTLTYSNAILRANFRLGVDEDGHAYGEYEGSTANSGRARVTAPDVLPADTWTHLALTYSGKDDVISLYMNGEVAPVATVRGTGLIPANGILGIRQEYYASVMSYGYQTLPCMTVFGAHAQNGAALALDKTTQWGDFGSFFKGWIDEVRIWDGVRTPSEIHAYYRTRLTMDDIKLMRSREDDSGIQGFYEQWFEWVGTKRSDPLERAALPAELLQHYNFTALPGGLEPKNVLTEPVEFQKNVLDNVRKPNGKSLDSSLLAGWWSETPVHSTVYWNYAVIPWIGNTVAHLPFLDGSSPDSQYWSEKIAGVMNVEEVGFTSYDYPNEANPYPYYFYRRDRFNRHILLEDIEGIDRSIATNSMGITSSSLAWKWRFQLRSEFLGTSDLVPLGGAYARRDTDFWDGQGAMDVWTETSKDGELADANGNGIPDWAEALGLTTADAYLRALAEGLLPDGSKDPDYADMADLKRDGVKDWWQKMYGLTGSAHNDTDQDGLADFAEYLVSEVFKFGKISPLLAKSNSKEFDYFRKTGKLYLGELFSDHDHMEDGFEREWAEIGADPAYYDSHLDSDEDGWSNWSEVRAKSDMGLGIAELDTSVTNVFYYTIPREDYAGYACYGDFKAMSDALNDLQTKGELIVEDAQFITAGFGHTYVQDSVRNLPGCPSGKNGEYHTDRYGTGWFRIRFISTPYGRTWRYRGHPTPNVSMTIHYNGVEDLDGRSLQVSAYTDGELKRADATFTIINSRSAKIGENRNVNTLSFLAPDNGYLREGKNTFVVTVAPSNSTGSASAAAKPAIIGVARDVDVGWSKVEFDVALLDESPICPRPALTYSIEGENTANSSSSNDGSAETGSGTSHVYVYRYAVDEYKPPSSLENRLVLDKDIGTRTYLYEGDFLADGAYDIDWPYFQSEVVGNPAVARNGFPVTSVTYRVYSQLVNISAEATSNITPYVEFSREFGKMRATAVPVAPGDYASIFYSACPTFVWRMTGDRPDTYTAFAIQVLDAAGTTPIWNSGTQLAPPRNINGEYEWQAPLYPDDQTALGKLFANTNNYTWCVTMYNAKYQSPYWSEKRNFRMNVYAEDEVNIADTYSIRVAVKYFGPGSFNTDASETKGTLRVEAFTSPDFSGQPAGRAFVRDLASVTDTVHTVNAKIIGLKSGTYYVRAYIDSDGDFKRDVWESWGYACPRGDVVTGSIFAPSAVTIGEGVEPPSVQVYVEDCDTDQDCLPDVWEYNEANGVDGFLTQKGPMENTHNGYISVNPGLTNAISDLINGGSSLSLLSIGPTQMPKTLAALMLGTDSVEPSIDAKTLAIKSLTLADGNVTIALAAEAEDPAAGTVFVTDGMVKVTVVVKYADSLSGEWNSVEKSIEKKIEDGAVSEELTFSLEDLGLDASKGFFKVEVKQ